MFTLFWKHNAQAYISVLSLNIFNIIIKKKIANLLICHEMFSSRSSRLEHPEHIDPSLRTNRTILSNSLHWSRAIIWSGVALVSVIQKTFSEMMFRSLLEIKSKAIKLRAQFQMTQNSVFFHRIYHEGFSLGCEAN